MDGNSPSNYVISNYINSHTNLNPDGKINKRLTVERKNEDKGTKTEETLITLLNRKLKNLQ